MYQFTNKMFQNIIISKLHSSKEEHNFKSHLFIQNDTTYKKYFFKYKYYYFRSIDRVLCLHHGFFFWPTNRGFSQPLIAYKILIVRCHRKSCKLPRAILFAFYRNTWYFLSRCCGCNQGSVANVITLKMPCIAKTAFVKWVLTISWKNTGGQCGPFKFTGLRFL